MSLEGHVFSHETTIPSFPYSIIPLDSYPFIALNMASIFATGVVA